MTIKKVVQCYHHRTTTKTTSTHRQLSALPWYGYDTMLRAKMQAQRLSAIYYRAGAEQRAPSYTRRGQRVAMCGDTLGIQQRRVVVQWHCEDRLCPLCAAKSARRIAANARAVLERARAEADLRPYMLTLTQRNCAPDALRERVADILRAWDAITHGLRSARKHVRGYARTVEITISRDGTYHPHLHAILLLAPDSPRKMLRARYWALLWQRYMDTQRYQADIIPICDIRPIRPNPRKGLTDSAAAAAEVAKYTAKSSDILTRAHAYEHVMAIDSAISGRRLRSYGGVWRQLRAQMRLEDATTAPDPDARYVASAPLEVWQWAGAEYRRIT